MFVKILTNVCETLPLLSLEIIRKNNIQKYSDEIMSANANFKFFGRPKCLQYSIINDSSQNRFSLNQ